jgi:hypothetical protein
MAGDAPNIPTVDPEASLFGGAAELDLTLKEHDAPVAGASVLLWLEETNGKWTYLGSSTTDAQGRCAIHRLPTGVAIRGRLEPPHPRPQITRAGPPDPDDGLFQYPLLETLVLEPGELREVTWTLPPRCVVEGVVRDSEGRAVADLSIGLFQSWGGDRGHGIPVLADPWGPWPATCARTDAEGRFRLRDAPPGDWWIGPTPAGMVGNSPGNDLVAPALRPLSIPAGTRTLSHDLTVCFDLWIRGRVVDSEGRGVRGKHLSFGRRTPASGEDGAFALGPLEPGIYEFWLDGRSYRARAGDEDLVLRVP